MPPYQRFHFAILFASGSDACAFISSITVLFSKSVREIGPIVAKVKLPSAFASTQIIFKLYQPAKEVYEKHREKIAKNRNVFQVELKKSELLPASGLCWGGSSEF